MFRAFYLHCFLNIEKLEIMQFILYEGTVNIEEKEMGKPLITIRKSQGLVKY